MQGAAGVYRLKCEAQQYAWGKIGNHSKVAEYAASTDTFKVDPSKPYAELWMGTHPNAPSKIFTTNQDLGKLIKENPGVLTAECYQIYNGDLPFLLKVLSVNTALSIQAHPNKTLAKELFEKRPDIYKDPNHKPEMAIALTDFEALCGFRPLEEIVQFLEQYPELRSLLGEAVSNRLNAVLTEKAEAQRKKLLQELFGALMRADPQRVATHLENLVARLSALPNKSAIEELIIRLNQQYPKDVGCFCVFFLNYLILKPGDAVFLAANLPHAYIAGDCIECMATSDNVVRAGLTPKLRDVETLVTMLDYTYGAASEFVVKGKSFDKSKSSNSSVLYDPPVPEFAVLRTSLNKNEREDFRGIEGPSILIVTSGQGTLTSGDLQLSLETGHVYFIAAGFEISLLAKSHGFACYRAFCEAK